MTILDQLHSDMTAALKAGDQTRLSTLRLLLAAVKNFAIAKYGAEADAKLTDADVTETTRKQAKTHRESIEAFEKGGRQDLVDKEKAELAILESYLPKALSDEELKALLAPVADSRETNFGLLMKQAMVTVAGSADGSRVASILKYLIQK